MSGIQNALYVEMSALDRHHVLKTECNKNAISFDVCAVLQKVN